MKIDNLRQQAPTTQQAMMSSESSTSPVQVPTQSQNSPALTRPPLNNLDSTEEQQPLLIPANLPPPLLRPPSPPATPTTRTPTTPLSPLAFTSPTELSLAAKTLDYTAKILKGTLIVAMGAAVGAVIGTTLIPAIGATIGITVGAMAAPALGAGLAASLLVLTPAINEVKHLANQSLYYLGIRTVMLSTAILGFYLALHPFILFSSLPIPLTVALGISGGFMVTGLQSAMLKLENFFLGTIQFSNLSEALANMEKIFNNTRSLKRLSIINPALAVSSTACLIGFTLTSGVAFSTLPTLISISTILAFGGAANLGLSGVTTLSRETLRLFSQVASRFSSPQVIPSAA